MYQILKKIRNRTKNNLVSKPPFANTNLFNFIVTSISASQKTIPIAMAQRSYHNYWVYILTNKPNGTLYIGVTGGIDDRMERHIKGQGSKFTAKYKLKMLVYFEEFQYIDDAIAREKQLKNWHRQWKINLIEEHNPNWDNLWNRDADRDAETSSA
jgi:putative endonuclease